MSSPFPFSIPSLPPLPKFNGTCVPIQYPCYPGDRYIDPCDCKFYYLCRTTSNIVRLSCSRGTAYDHTTSQAFCQRKADVVNTGKCDQQLPWQRCLDQYSSADLQKLKSWCTTSGYLTPAPPRRGSDDGGNAGAIAAIVILLLLFIVAVVVIVVYVRKKGNPLPKMKETKCWQNLAWCWNEVICCKSDGEGYYYDDDDDDVHGDDTERARGAGGVEGGREAKEIPGGDRVTKLKVEKEERRGIREEDEDGGTYHDFGEEEMRRRRSHRRSQQDTILEDPHSEAAAAALAAPATATASLATTGSAVNLAVYDNPAFDPNMIRDEDDNDDAPPPDTELSPAPPAYSRAETPSRQLKFLATTRDADLIEASFEDEESTPVHEPEPRVTARSINQGPSTARSARSLSVPTAFHFAEDSDTASDSSYMA